MSDRDLWGEWRNDPEIRDLAESWITKPAANWTSDDDQFYRTVHSEPDRALATIFAMIQLTNDPEIHASIGAGQLEDFLGIHGETYLDSFHASALRERLLREVLDGVWQGAMSKRVWQRVETLKQSRFY